MATSFNLTAQLNLRGPTNLKPIVADIRRQLGTISTDVKINIDDRSARSVDVVSTRLRAMNDILVKARQNTIALNSSLKDLSASLGTVQSAGNRAAQGMGKTADTAAKSASNIRVARTEMEEFGRQSALAVRRFAAFTVVTSSIFALTNAITSGFKAFIQFDKELIRLQQVTGKGKVGIQGLENEITKLATSLGVSSESLTSVATTLAQAGLSANETRIALSALAKTELAPSFQNLTKTTEGAIAAIRQFSLGAGDLEAALGSINAVAAAFAVESGDIIAAIQRTGGVFASASKGVSEGKDALNEFIAVFTSVRATTRESAETIATGLRTIFTRIQRAKTIDQLKEFGVQLQDIEGKFVGPFEAVKRLSAALNQLDPRDIRFSTIVEELGGFRQIGKVIPLIQQFATAQQALGVAQRGQSSLTDAQIIAQQSLANQIAKVREQFLALIRDIGKSSSFQGLFKIVTGLTSGLISLAGAFKPILPILAIFGAIKGISAVGQFGAGLFGGLKKGGGPSGAGQNVGATISGAKEQERTEATNKASEAIRNNTTALSSLTVSIDKLISKIDRLNTSSGSVPGFASGGIVPGSGNRDTVQARLTPGEFVIRKKAVEAIGANNLYAMNKYNSGGIVQQDQVGAAILQGRTTRRDQIIGKSDILSQISDKENKGYIQDTLQDDKQYQFIKNPLSKEANELFEKAINKGAIDGLNSATKVLGSSLGVPSLAVPSNAKLRQNFIDSLNDAARGNLFEQILSSIRNQGRWEDKPDPQAPFDFVGPFDGQLAELFPDIASTIYKDAKASFTAASKENMSKKIGNQILREGGAQQARLSLSDRVLAVKDKLGALQNTKGFFDTADIARALGISSLSGVTSLLKDNIIAKAPIGSGKYILPSQRLNKGGLVGSPLIDDIVNATGTIAPRPNSAISALMQAGGGAIDIDRTIKRTIGDKAYSSAKTAEQQAAVLDRYFRDSQARLSDIKSSPLTSFGQELKQAIQSKQINPNSLSIISKSKRTPGVAEYLSQLFSIPVDNMIFTQGGSKQPAVDALRQKGPRAMRKFAKGGLAVNKLGSQLAQDFNLGQGQTTAWNQLENNCLAIATKASEKFNYISDPDKIRQQLDMFQKLRLGKTSAFGLKPTEEMLKKSSSLNRMLNNPTMAASSGNIVVREGDEMMKHVSFEHKNKEYNFGAAGKDWPIVLRIPLKKIEEQKAYGGSIKRFAKGGSTEDTIPALLTPGEFVINKKAAKTIGYAKLEQLNQADKLQGYNKGGYVGYVEGGKVAPASRTLSKEERKRRKEQFLAEQRGEGGPGTGFVTREEARAVGAVRPDFGAGASRKRDVMATPQGAENAAKIEAAVLNNYKKLYAQEKQEIDALYKKLESQAEQDFIEGKIDLDQLSSIFSDLGDFKALKKSQAKERLKAEAFSASEKAVQDYTRGKQAPQIEERKTADLKASDTEIKSAMQAVVKEAKAKYEQLYNEERQSLKDFYGQRYKQVQAEGGDVGAVVAEYKEAVANAKQSLKSGLQAEIKEKQANVPQKLGEETAAQLNKFREEKGRAADPFYDAKRAADESAATTRVVNPKIAEEQKAFFAYKARQSGVSASGLRENLTRQVGAQAFAISEERQFAKTESKNVFAGRARELKGVDVSRATAEGATGEEATKVQGIIESFATSLRKVDPSLGLGEARKAATELATGLSSGTQSIEEIINSNEQLKAVFEKTFTETENLDEAFRRVSEAAGISAETLKAEISPGRIKQEQFINSEAGQRFGSLARIAPGLTEQLSQSKLGGALGKGADFISGKGGGLSKAFASVGGIAGLGAGASVLADTLRQNVKTSDPNVAGAIGALGGAGTGAASGAVLGAQIAGPVGALVAGVGGAIIGGIQGFFSAKNQQILTNALENVAKSAGNLDLAFKKLDQNASSVNLQNAQKAFGSVLDAGKDIDKLALSKSGFGATDAVSTGGIALAAGATGAGLGALVGSVVPILGTAIGAAVGGAIGTIGGAAYGFFNRPSEAQRKEALGASIQQASSSQQVASRLAETQLKSTSTEDIDKILKNIQEGTGDLNPIVAQYQKGMIEAAGGTQKLTAKQIESISVQAQEKAALDAFVKSRKESGATDDQINKELQGNRKAAIAEGQNINKVNGELIAKQALVAKATKEVAIAAENLLDVYRRIGAQSQRYSTELQAFTAELDTMIGGLGGDTSMRPVDRANEAVLSNLSAYSADEVKSAADSIAGFLGNTPEAQDLANTASASKILQDQLPALLRNAEGAEGRDQAIDQLEQLFKDQNLGSAAIDQVLTDIRAKVAQDTDGKIGTLIQEIDSNIVDKFSQTAQKGAETLANLAKTYNNTLQQAREYQERYNKAILESNSLLRKATQIRLNSELDLAKALGKSPTLEQLNKPFDIEVQSLTSGLVKSGDLLPENAGDPTAIADAISAAQKRNVALSKQPGELLAAGASLPEGAAGDPLRQQLNQAQLDNIQAIGENNVAINEGRQALEKLANDGTKAANALGKIQEEQQALEGLAGFAKNLFTANPQQLAELELQTSAFAASQTAGPEFFKSRFNRQQAFAGLEAERGFLTGQEYRDAQAKLLEGSFKAQGFKEGDVVKTIGGKDFTLEEFLERIRGGVSEEDPNVKAYREASEVQARANEKLGRLNIEQATIIQTAMNGLEVFLSTKFPDILTKAVTDARTDSQAKPVVGTEKGPTPSGPTATQVELETAKTDAEAKKRALTKAETRLKTEEDKGIFASGPAVSTAKAIVSTAKKEKETADKRVSDLQAQADAEQRALSDQQANAQAKAKSEKEAADSAKATKTQQEKTEKTESTLAASVAARESQPVPVVVASTPTAIPQTVPAQLSGVPTQEDIAQLEKVKAAKEKELAQKENRLKAVRVAAAAAGTLKDESGQVVNERVLAAQQSFEGAKQDLESINEQLLAPRINQQFADAGLFATPGSERTPQDPNALRLPTAQTSPVPATMPQQVTYTSRQMTPTEEDKKLQSATMITIDPSSIEALNTFNSDFASYVDRLVSFEFPNIPEKIEMIGTHTVDVRITGAAAFESLQTNIKNLINTAVNEKMSQIWNQTGGSLGSRPGSSPSSR